MQYVRIWVHFVFPVRNGKALIAGDARKKIFEHIRWSAGKQGIAIDAINGCADHCHVLAAMTPDQTPAQLVRQIREESTLWINGEQFLPQSDFAWDDDYFALSVSESQAEAVRSYIRRQEIHHRKKSFAEECDELLEIFHPDPSKKPPDDGPDCPGLRSGTKGGLKFREF